jgi:hypothetical protein
MFSFCWVLEVITTIMTSSYHFYFVFVPRRTSNWRKVRFEEVAVLKQISALYRKNSWKFPERLFNLRFLVHMPQVIAKVSLVSHFSIWATEDFQKNRSLPAVLFWHISVTICVCLSIAFFLSSFDHGTFERVATVAYSLIGVIFELKLNQKSRFTIMLTLMLLIELCEVLYEGSFQVYSKENDEMRWSMDNISSLGMPILPQEISKRYKRQSLGMPGGTPSSSAKIRSPFKILYFYCFVFYAFYLERLYFCFQFYFVLFATINGWTPT